MTDRRVAIVTGGARGIGAATVAALAQSGHDVVVNYLGNEAAARDVADEVDAVGGTAVLVRGDVSNAADVARLFDQTVARLGDPHVVVNNAGRPAPRLVPLAETDESEFDAVFAVNARGAFLVLREAARRVLDGGAIINVSTGGTVTSAARNGIYTASKAAGENLVLALAKELGSRGIRVNAVLPGLTETDQLADFPEEARGPMLAATPLGRFGTPPDVAAVIAFLAGDQGRWMTGQLIRATGGLV